MKVDRLVSIILLLLDRDRVGAAELAALFEVSERTIYRDIDAINLAGVPVRSTSGVGGGFEILKNYKIDRNVFSAADLSALLMGLSSLSGLSGLMRGNEPVNALAKVKSFIPADRAKDIEAAVNRIRVDVSPWSGNRNLQPAVETVNEAMRESRILSFDYAGLRGNRTPRSVEPCQLVLKGSHWYLYGYCRTRRDYRLFKLSRVSNLRADGGTFEPRDFPKPRLDVSEMLGALRTTVTLRFHDSALDRVLDYCDPETMTRDGVDHWIVPFPFMENDFYFDMLLGFGPACECLGPPRIREGLLRRLRETARLYERDDTAASLSGS